MNLVECSGCGSKELVEKDGFMFCVYCQSKNLPKKNDKPSRETQIELASDIELLIKKCIDDPVNKRRYANLILDLDPTNLEAKKYLQ